MLPALHLLEADALSLASHVLRVHSASAAREAQVILNLPAGVVLVAELDEHDVAPVYWPGAEPSSQAFPGHLAKEATSEAAGAYVLPNCTLGCWFAGGEEMVWPTLLAAVAVLSTTTEPPTRL